MRSSRLGTTSGGARGKPDALGGAFSPRPGLREFANEFASELGRQDRLDAFALCLERLLRGNRRQRSGTGLPQFGAHARAMHQFVNYSPWPYDAVLANLRRRLFVRDAHKTAALVLSEFHVTKYGRHSVGVSRHLSDWANLYGGSRHWNSQPRSMRGQLAITWSWADSTLCVPVATQLYLPPEWTSDPGRLDRARVPEGAQGLGTRCDTAFHLLRKIKGDLPAFHAAVFDEQYGSSLEFLSMLEGQQIPYVAKVPPTLSKHPLVPAQFFSSSSQRGTPRWWARRGRFAQYRRGLRNAWHHYDTWPPLAYFQTDGPPRHFLRYWTEMIPLNEPSRGLRGNRWLIIVPNGHRVLNLDLYVSNLPVETPRAVFAELIYQLQAVKTEQRRLHARLSAGHFEGRSWHGFHHHVVLSMLAGVFLMQHPEYAT